MCCGVQETMEKCLYKWVHVFFVLWTQPRMRMSRQHAEYVVRIPAASFIDGHISAIKDCEGACKLAHVDVNNVNNNIHIKKNQLGQWSVRKHAAKAKQKGYTLTKVCTLNTLNTRCRRATQVIYRKTLHTRWCSHDHLRPPWATFWPQALLQTCLCTCSCLKKGSGSKRHTQRSEKFMGASSLCRINFCFFFHVKRYPQCILVRNTKRRQKTRSWQTSNHLECVIIWGNFY